MMNIISKEDYIKRTIAIAKGECVPEDSESRLWCNFSSLINEQIENLYSCEDLDYSVINIERLSEAMEGESEVVPEINSIEDLDEGLSKGKVTINDFTKEELQSAFRTLDESRSKRNYDKLKDITL